MKISPEGILGSAQKISNRKKIEQGSQQKDSKGVKGDSVSISNKINSRIETIEKEVKEIQTSLSKNQIIKNGIGEMEAAAASGGNPEEVLTRTTFNGSAVLREFINEQFSSEILSSKKDEVNNLITGDINKLTRVQVEVDNIIASDLAGNRKVENLMSDINGIFGNGQQDLGSISNLNADKVMKLVK